MNLASQSAMKVLATPMLSRANKRAFSARPSPFTADSWRAAACHAGPRLAWVQNFTASVYAAVRAVLRDALDAGGSSLRDYRQANGELGYFQHAFAVYVRTNPWAADAHLSPKSVVREMWERAFTFREFVNTYGLTRAEGAVLRYLSDAFKALRSGVPASARTEEVKTRCRTILQAQSLAPATM